MSYDKSRIDILTWSSDRMARLEDQIMGLESELAAAKAEIAKFDSWVSHGVNAKIIGPTPFELLKSENARLRAALEKIYEVTRVMSDLYSRDIGTIAASALEGKREG